MKKLLWGSTKRKIATVLVGVLLVGAAAAGGGDGSTGDDGVAATSTSQAATSSIATSSTEPAASTISGPVATTTSAAAQTTSSSTTTEPPTTTITVPVISAGTYVVGAEVQPGVYRATSYWARLDAATDILDNDLNAGSVIMVVQASDFALTYSGTLEKIG